MNKKEPSASAAGGILLGGEHRSHFRAFASGFERLSGVPELAASR